MKKTTSIVVSIFLALIASTHELAAKNNNSQDQEVAGETEKGGKRNTTTVTIAASPDQVHDAALEALAGIGCKIKKDKPTQIEGKRPNKVGLAVGSGGEKLFVEIVDLENGSCELTVKTKKTMAGIVGQKLWNEEVAQAIVDALK